MTGNHRILVSLGLGTAALAAIPVIAQQRAPTSRPIARYDMRAGTVSGFAAMGGGLAGLVVGSMLLPLVGSLLGMMAGSFGLAYWVERNRLQTSAPAAHIATGAVLACIAILMLKVAVALVLVAVLFAGIVMS